MNAPRSLLSAIWLGLLCAGLGNTAGMAHAAVYVVDAASPNAADANPGSEHAPFATIQQAANTARPGDTIYVVAGRYRERVAMKTSGTQGRPITWREHA